METKQRATKNHNASTRKSKRKLKNIQTTMKTQPHKVCGIPQKQFLEGSL